MRETFLLMMVVFAGTGGEISVTRAMKQIGEVHSFAPWDILHALGRALRQGWMWLGLGLMSLAFFCLMTLLSWENVSFVIPATALSYAVGALGGKFLLGERVSPIRWFGVSLVCLGVALVWVG
jgi:drug/metabolite transporter (DMT)-like permease